MYPGPDSVYYRNIIENPISLALLGKLYPITRIVAERGMLKNSHV
jgi:hypothetical protein